MIYFHYFFVLSHVRKDASSNITQTENISHKQYCWICRFTPVVLECELQSPPRKGLKLWSRMDCFLLAVYLWDFRWSPTCIFLADIRMISNINIGLGKPYLRSVTNTKKVVGFSPVSTCTCPTFSLFIFLSSPPSVWIPLNSALHGDSSTGQTTTEEILYQIPKNEDWMKNHFGFI